MRDNNPPAVPNGNKLVVQMLYLTALMFFSAKIFFYYRFQKNPPKYK